MDSTHVSFLSETGRGLMNNNNYTVKFVPLIAVMATVVPKLLSKIKQIQPTPTVTARDVVGLRTGRYYFKESIDKDLCTFEKYGELKGIPEFPGIFYRCKIKRNTSCKSEMKKAERPIERIRGQFLGRVSGRNSCLYVEISRCSYNHDFRPPYTPGNGKCSDYVKLSGAKHNYN